MRIVSLFKSLYLEDCKQITNIVDQMPEYPSNELFEQFCESQKQILSKMKLFNSEIDIDKIVEENENNLREY